MGSCVCYTGVSLYQRTHLRTHSLKIVHICVYVWMCVCACICIWMHMCVYDIAWHVEVLSLGFSICTYVCICMRMYMCVHVCVYRCMCICGGEAKIRPFEKNSIIRPFKKNRLTQVSQYDKDCRYPKQVVSGVYTQKSFFSFIFQNFISGIPIGSMPILMTSYRPVPTSRTANTRTSMVSCTRRLHLPS